MTEACREAEAVTTEGGVKAYAQALSGLNVVDPCQQLCLWAKTTSCGVLLNYLIFLWNNRKSATTNSRTLLLLVAQDILHLVTLLKVIERAGLHLLEKQD